MKPLHAAPLNQKVNQPSLLERQKADAINGTPEMRKAAEGLEAIFTSEIMKAMRNTVEPSEFSLHNSATDIYQGMLDQEYAEASARNNTLGLSKQIIDYWLRSEQQPQYNKERNQQIHPLKKEVLKSTGGTDENQSS